MNNLKMQQNCFMYLNNYVCLMNTKNEDILNPQTKQNKKKTNKASGSEWCLGKFLIIINKQIVIGEVNVFI